MANSKRAYWHFGSGHGLIVDAVLGVLAPDIRVGEFPGSQAGKIEAVAVRVDDLIGLPKSDERSELRAWQRHAIDPKVKAEVEKRLGRPILWSEDVIAGLVRGQDAAEAMVASLKPAEKAEAKK